MKISVTIHMEQRVIGAPPTVSIDCPPDLSPLQGLSMCLGAQQLFLQAEANYRLAQQAASAAEASAGKICGADGRPLRN